MKKKILVLTALIFSGLVISFFLLILPRKLSHDEISDSIKSVNDFASANQCEKDVDCKLIYNNCECLSVPTQDQRSQLEDEREACIWNVCRGTNVQAVCQNNKCIRSDQK